MTRTTRNKWFRLGLHVTLSCSSLALTGCEYARLTRPKALKQLTPDMVRLVNELPEVDRPNEKIVARLFAHGGLDHAKRGEDGVYRMNVRVPEGQYIWNPAIIVMEEGGDLELEFKNEDSFSYHGAYIQSNGGRQTVTLPVKERGKLKVQLDGPGLYWFGCPVSNHATRGMLGMIMVGGNVPAEARLDRPQQSRDSIVPIKSDLQSDPLQAQRRKEGAQ
ncbi:MAG: MSMEG_3727 family PQQ-associated protein [Verrucomicrobiales bacterium]